MKIGPQRLILGSNCFKVGTVAHEMLHAIGFWHEQSRPDRDDHVKVFFDNIKSNMKFNFQIQSIFQQVLMDKPYDLGSVMHYGKYGFSKNSKPTIISLNGAAIGQRRGFSSCDIEKINTLYGCGGR